MNGIREELERLAAAPAPAPAVDVAAAVTKGRRIRRIRRTRRAAAVAAAAGVTAAVVVLPSSGERPDDVAKPSSYGPPLVARASFGWLPAGYARTRMSQDAQERAAFSVSAGRGPGSTAVELTVLGPGPQPPVARLPGGRKGRLTEAAPVNGRPAHWTIKPGGPGSDQVAAEFRWEYRPRSWALLSVNDRALADVATVRRIAAEVSFTGGEPVAFPMSVEGVPAGLKVARVWSGTRPDAYLDLRDPGGDGALMIGLTQASARPWKPNTTVDGRAAFDSRLSRSGPSAGTRALESQTLRVYGVRGFDVDVTATGEPLRRLQATGGLTGLFRRITPLGDDPAHWTTTPLR
ncbi:hypothetical protein E1200_14930 [Actinomadura sp. GC306]|uniref:hypothetical protein n=1 Tax=Actinomadura sp. GC306 TaxID=2530367 RepID=UPI0010471510|nr:hypothetical protein [Actinomadura sp. GC306]TDC67433.1 hypothetical protein E1200_14930 [Actinomadura sp. GC306]